MIYIENVSHYFEIMFAFFFSTLQMVFGQCCISASSQGHTFSSFLKLNNSPRCTEKIVSISVTEEFFICFLRCWFIISYKDEVGNINKTHYHHERSVLLTILSFFHGLFVCVCCHLPQDWMLCIKNWATLAAWQMKAIACLETPRSTVIEVDNL